MITKEKYEEVRASAIAHHGGQKAYDLMGEISELENKIYYAEEYMTDNQALDAYMKLAKLKSELKREREKNPLPPPPSPPMEDKPLLARMRKRQKRNSA